MYKNYNVRFVQPFTERIGDGTVRSLPIDQFIVSDKSLYKADGFPRSDVGLLDRFNKSNVDPDLVNQIAARMQELSTNEETKGLSDDIKLKLLRPAWCQTATELANFSEHVYRVIEENKESLKEVDTSTITSEVESSVENSDDIKSE